MNDKVKIIKIGDFNCDYIVPVSPKKVVYMIYPGEVQLPENWLASMSEKYNVAVLVVYIPANGWNDLLTPWPEPPEEKGFEPFAGKAPEFLKTLLNDIMPQLEKAAGIGIGMERDLIGVSLSGLFTFWQWLQCNSFKSIGCLSGSFWYMGFMNWFEKQTLPAKPGKAFFLLGKKEPKAPIKAYQSVGINTTAIVERLKSTGIDTEFEWVPGDHFVNPLPRAELAFDFLCKG